MFQFKRTDSHIDRLPSFTRDPRRKKLWFLLWFIVLCFDNCVLPLGLYYELRYRTRAKLSTSLLYFLFRVHVLVTDEYASQYNY